MSEDYKKIALEDVKKGQRVRVVERRSAFTVTYEGAVFRTSPEWDRIDLGEEGDEVTIIVDPEPEPGTDFDILLLEDAPKPKVVRTETVTITHYDDGTKTETPDTKVWVPMVIKTIEQFEEYEEYLKKTLLRDTNGNYWEHTSGSWEPERTYVGMWLGKTRDVIEACLPLTVVETFGD